MIKSRFSGHPLDVFAESGRYALFSLFSPSSTMRQMSLDANIVGFRFSIKTAGFKGQALA